MEVARRIWNPDLHLHKMRRAPKLERHELKPLATKDESQIEYIAAGNMGLMYPQGEHEGRIKLYAIPDTHRLVPVEFLNVVAMIVTEARDYYSDMNDNVCQSYADPWKYAADACRELCAIIDNKESGK